MEVREFERLLHIGLGRQQLSGSTVLCSHYVRTIGSTI